MSGTRFARSGRWRFFFCLGACVLLFVMFAIFHSSQRQLDETREQQLRCEQQHEALNERLQSIIEKKAHAEKQHEHELRDERETRHNLEVKLKDLIDAHAKEQMEQRVRYDKLQQSNKLLQSEHNELVSECARTKKQHLEDTNAMEKKLQALRSEMKKEQSVQTSEITTWREKYNAIVRENKRLEVLLNAAGSEIDLHNHVASMERTIADYKRNCEYKPRDMMALQQINKPLNPPDTTRNASPQPHSFDKPRNEKSFSEQILVSPGLYHIPVNRTTNKSQQNAFITNNPITNNQKKVNIDGEKYNGDGNGAASSIATATQHQNLLSSSFGANNHSRSLIINSVENFQIVPKAAEKKSEEPETQLKQQPADAMAAAAADAIAVAVAAANRKVSPLSAPHKHTSADNANAKISNVHQHDLKANGNSSTSTTSTSSSSTSLPPLPLPPNSRKLPENVAPIPAIFDELLQNDQHAVEGHDIDAAMEDGLPKGDNDDGNNNRYANVVNDMENKQHQAAVAANEDSGAHEIKDHDFMNGDNFNLPPEDDNNGFFEGGGGGGGGGIKHNGVNNADGIGGMGPNKRNKNDDDNEDEDLALGAGGAGDIAVRNRNHLLDAENINNEIAGDQGKEFPDGLRLEEGNDEDEDEDDYSNPAARQKGEHAIRN